MIDLGELRVGRFLVSTNVNGPGRRFVIWFQGCPLRCRGCFNPEFHEESGGFTVETGSLIETILSIKDKIEGVTFTGGEPLAQGEELVNLASAVKSMDLTLVCFTGYEIEEILEGRTSWKELLQFIDILIDGRYVEEESAPLLWRGSRNQRVHFLTDRYVHLAPLVTECSSREVEVKICDDGVYITGIFDGDFWEEFKRRLVK